MGIGGYRLLYVALCTGISRTQALELAQAACFLCVRALATVTVLVLVSVVAVWGYNMNSYRSFVGGNSCRLLLPLLLLLLLLLLSY